MTVFTTCLMYTSIVCFVDETIFSCQSLVDNVTESNFSYFPLDFTSSTCMFDVSQGLDFNSRWEAVLKGYCQKAPSSVCLLYTLFVLGYNRCRPFQALVISQTNVDADMLSNWSLINYDSLHISKVILS